jgi:hypothetical protein
MVCWLGGRAELWEPFLATMQRLTPRPPAVLALQMDTYIHPVRTGVAALPRLDAALRAVPRETDPHVIENVATCATYADRLGELREPLWRMVQRGRAGGPARKQLTALANLCFDDFVRGDWGEAQELAAEGLKVAEERAGRFFGWYFRYVDADVDSLTGPRQPAVCQFDDLRLKPQTVDLELKLAVRLEEPVAGRREADIPDAGEVPLPATRGDETREHVRGAGLDDQFATRPGIRVPGGESRGPAQGVIGVGVRGISRAERAAHGPSFLPPSRWSRARVSGHGAGRG